MQGRQGTVSCRLGPPTGCCCLRQPPRCKLVSCMAGERWEGERAAQRKAGCSAALALAGCG